VIGLPRRSSARCTRYFTELTCKCNSSAVALKLDPVCRNSLSVSRIRFVTVCRGGEESQDVADPCSHMLEVGAELGGHHETWIAGRRDHRRV